MRKFLLSLFSAIALFTVSCSEPYDDSALSGRIDNLESRVAQLEEMCRQINTNIASLQTIVSALQNNDYITGVTAITENGETIGYKITFAKSKAITIYHGKDGDTPVISVTQNYEGDYYWTINGSPIVNEYGYEITINNSGTPQLKIENGYWYVSYDDGATWKELGHATDGSSSVFSSIDTSNSDYVIFTLADGTELAVPRYKNLSISFDIADGTACMPSVSIKVGYTLTGADEETAIEIFNDGDWKSVLTKTDASSGYITVTAPANGGEGKVIMLAVNSMGFSAMKAICFEEGVVTGINDAYRVGYEESTLEVSLQTNLAYTVSIPDDAQSWISVADTRAEMRDETLTFTILANPENSPKRSATIELLSNCDDVLQSFVIMQDLRPTDEAIVFADANVKKVCVEHFDTNGDGELSYKEAAAVTTISKQFFGNYADVVTSFDELQYFTSLNSLSTYAFEYCSSLESITIPEGVTSIGDYAFYNCKSLPSITLPYSITSIGNGAFFGCSSLIDITIPKGVTSIGHEAFYNCTSLESITIPDSITSIGWGAFSKCSSLTAFYGKYASADNRCLIVDGELIQFAPAGLTSYTILNSVTSIGWGVFEYCSSLTSITIPEGVTLIGEYAFFNCSSLESITIPEGVTSIDNSAFAYCSSLTSITIPESITLIGEYAFSGCSSLESITLPSSVTSIGNYAFSGCSSLESITIPNSVTAIEAGVFEGCSSLENITIPDSVTSIGYEAFSDCLSLATVYIKNPTPPIYYDYYSSPFRTCTNLEKIYVPTESVDAYKTANIWSDRASIIVGYDFSN